MTRSLLRSLFASSVASLALLVTPTAGMAVDEFPLPNAGSQPAGITTGPDGALWFTEEAGNRIGRITTSGGITEYSTGLTAGSLPAEIVAGPDGRLWFTESGRNHIGAIATNGTITEYPGTDAPPDGITVGPDGALWFTEYHTGTGLSKVGRITTDGVITVEHGLPFFSEPGDIVTGPDGNLWFTEANANKVGRITPGGIVSHLTVPTGGSDPSGITASAAALWFAEFSASKVGRIDPFAGATGTITNEFGVGSGPSSIATGPDGALWFTEEINRIGRMTTTGVLTNEFAIPTPASEPAGIAAGPDGALWFTEKLGNRIGRIATAPPFVPPPPSPSLSLSPAAAPAAKKAKKSCRIPKLRRLTVKQARKKLRRAKCRYRIRGKGRVYSVRPKAGTRTTRIVQVKCKRARR